MPTISPPSGNLILNQSAPNLDFKYLVSPGNKNLTLTTFPVNRAIRNPGVISIDGTASDSFTNSNFGTISLTTSNAGDLIYIAIQSITDTVSSAGGVVLSVTGGGLFFLKRKDEVRIFGSVMSRSEIWWAWAPNALAAEEFTVLFNRNVDVGNMVMFGTSAPNLDNPFGYFVPMSLSDDTGVATQPGLIPDAVSTGMGNLGLGFRFSISAPSGQTPGTGFSNVVSSDVSGSHIYVEAKEIDLPFSNDDFFEDQLLAYWTFFADEITIVPPFVDPNSYSAPGQEREDGLYIAVEIDVYDHALGASNVLRLCNRGPLFVDRNLFGSPRYYESLVLPISIGMQINAEVYGQSMRGSTAGGDITFLLSGLETWLSTIRFRFIGREFRVYTGFSELGYRSDLNLVYTGVISDITHDFVKVSLKTGDKINLLNKPILTAAYDNSFPTAIQGKIKPKLFGKVKNLEPVLEDDVNLVYRVTIPPSIGNALDDVTELSVGGVIWNKVSGTPGGGEWSVDVVAGTVELGSVTLGGEVRVCAQAPGYANFFTGDLLRAVVELSGGIVSSRAERFWASEGLDGTVGYYTGTSLINILSLLDDITQRQGGWWSGDDDGTIIYGPLTHFGGPFQGASGPFVGTDVLSFSENEIKEIHQSQTIPAVWRVRSMYGINWNPGSNFFEGVTDEEKKVRSDEGIITDPDLFGISDAGILNLDPAAADLVLKTLYSDFTYAYYAALRVFNAWKVERRILDIKAYCDPSLVRLYAPINIRFSFLNFDGLSHMAVRNLGDGPHEFKVWG